MDDDDHQKKYNVYILGEVNDDGSYTYFYEKQEPKMVLNFPKMAWKLPKQVPPYYIVFQRDHQRDLQRALYPKFPIGLKTLTKSKMI